VSNLIEISVAEIAIDAAGALRVRPRLGPSEDFRFIYRAMGVNWNSDRRSLVTPVPWNRRTSRGIGESFVRFAASTGDGLCWRRILTGRTFRPNCKARYKHRPATTLHDSGCTRRRPNDQRSTSNDGERSPRVSRIALDPIG